MKVITLILGEIETNCYIIIDEETGKAAVIDPGKADKSLFDAIKKIGNENIEYILLTHGHFDHIGAVNLLRQETGAKVVVSKEDENLIINPVINGSRMFGIPEVVCKPADIIANDGDLIKLGSLDIQVISTPGHTAGGVCYSCGGILFSGDTLFYKDCGRCDLPTSDFSKMLLSLRRLTKELPENTRVLTGHGRETTIGTELSFNPYLGDNFYETLS